MLQIGDKLPIDIEVSDLDNHAITLEKFIGKYLVIYFYPRDDTPGCTTEACSFRDYNDEITKLGIEIIGISKDSVNSHLKFKSKYNLNFHLLADPETKLQNAFGVWVEKSMYGRKYMGTQRATFVVDPQGQIIYVWEKVKPAGHAQEVFEKLKELMHS